MLILGLVLIVLGALAIVAEVLTGNSSGDFLGTNLSAETLFFIGLGSGVAILVGWQLTKWGTKRTLKQRRDQKQLDKLSSRVEQDEAQRHGDATDRQEPRTL